MKPILQIQNLSKRFQINHRGLPYLSLRDKLINLFTPGDKKEEFWALKDVSFSVAEGDCLGIIGRNGAGKSTLLKILSRITPPTTGRIVSRGRIASLLEVGTGFHQELTGRENVFMNGSILGMKRSEIRQKFDEIVEFSGTDKFLDTPLKYYSSGMQLRLAFAVAAHLEPEILIVDEVLAVGDAEFQKKCLKKMEDVNGQGRTVIFVSHNIPTLKTICKTGILLKEGHVAAEGTIDDVIDQYLAYHHQTEKIIDDIHYFQPHIKIHEVEINGQSFNSIAVDHDRLNLSFTIEFFKRTPFELDVHLKKNDTPVASYSNFVTNDVKVFEPGIYRLDYALDIGLLRSGKYKIDLYFTEPFHSWFAVTENVIDLEIISSRHHTFLNTSTLKWGSTLLQGSVEIGNVEKQKG